jgi:hypothetical protein
LFRLSTFLWFGFCNHCILSWFIWSKNFEHSSSNHGLCCFLSYSPRLPLAEILILSLMFFHALFMSSLTFKFYKAANLFEIFIWYWFLTSSSLSFLKGRIQNFKIEIMEINFQYKNQTRFIADTTTFHHNILWQMTDNADKGPSCSSWSITFQNKHMISSFHL